MRTLKKKNSTDYQPDDNALICVKFMGKQIIVLYIFSLLNVETFFFPLIG